MPARDLALLVDAARMAGRVATSFVGAQAERWEKPNGAGPVTEADLAVNDLLHAVLRAARPGYGWLSEETDDTAARLDRRDVFVIDPIDGTRSFVEGSRTWAHSLAVARGGEVIAGVVYLPMRDKLYAAARGQGATLNGAPIRASDTGALDLIEVLAAKPALKGSLWHGGIPPGFRRGYRPSLAYRMALVAQARFDAMLTLRPTWEWDIAAGTILIEEAGGTVTDRTGAPLRFNNRDPRLDGVIAGGRAAHDSLRAALA